MSVLRRLGSVVLDCPDPVALAAFYRKATGWELLHTDADFASLGDARGPVRLSFVRVAGYRAPAWPDGGAHAHLDFAVDDPERAAEELLALGAARPDAQPGGGEWLVLTDPAGHPFCLAAADPDEDA